MERWPIPGLLPCLLAIALAIAGVQATAVHPGPAGGMLPGDLCAAVPAGTGDGEGPAAHCADCILGLVALLPAPAAGARRAARPARRRPVARGWPARRPRLAVRARAPPRVA